MSKCLRLLSCLICLAVSLKASEPDIEPALNRDEPEVDMVVDTHGCLDLSGRNLDELPDITNIADYDKIKIINLSNNRLTNDSLKNAKRGVIPASVQAIDLSRNQLTDFPTVFISTLPKKVRTIDLRGNTISGIGDDVHIAQTGLKVFIDKKNLSEESLKTIRTRLGQIGANPTFWQRCAARLTSPCGRMTKLLGGVALFAGAECIRKVCDMHSQSPVTRAVKIIQNGLFVAGAVHTLYNTYYAQHKLVEDNPEMALGVAGLFLGTTPGLIHDTRELVSGRSAPINKIEATYAHAVYSGMRDLGTVYALGECVSWLKGKWARALHSSIDSQKNELIAN